MDARITDLFDLEFTLARPLFERFVYPWEALGAIADFIREVGPTLPEDEFDHPQDGVWIAKDVKMYASVSMTGPLIIDHDAEIRQCAFIRGSAIIGKRAVVGNSCELKNAVLFDGVQVPHYNYVGDSILGAGAHMGAGAVTSNLKADHKLVVIHGAGGENIPTGIKKVGAILGDGVDVGCNSVLCPGTVIGKGTHVYPLSCVRGFIPAHKIFKAADNIVDLLPDDEFAEVSTSPKA